MPPCPPNDELDATAPDSRPPSRPPSSHPSSSSVHGRFDPGTRLGTRYRVVGLLGRGGMGEVYRADDLELNQSVALKFLPERLARNAADLARLRSEVRTARQVAHPNVCRTYDIAEADGQIFVVMEYIDGEDLASVLRRLGRPSPDKALEIARQLCLGLGAAHENGVLHRDLKPANIMIDGRGRVRITDFGLAGTTEEIAAERGVSGTPAYMAPEQQRQGGGSAQSDIYSLGLVLYEIFTGKRVTDMTPRPDPSRRSGTAGESDSSVRTPSSIVGDIDPAVERVILRCLEHDPARRPQSAYAVFGALPGGDPLAAAVAAGETPSPELVANAGVEGSVRPLYAAIAVAAVLAGLAVISIAQKPQMEGLDRSGQVLSVRAEEVLANATGKAPPRFSAEGFLYGPPADTTKPRPKLYWRRWSPAPITPENIHDPAPGREDPPQTYPGSGTVALDTHGRLVGLLAVPDLRGGSASGGPAADWNAIVEAARGSRSDAHRDSAGAPVPSAVPAGFVAPADSVAAWRISAEGAPDTTLVVASLGGRIVQVSTYASGKPLADLAPEIQEFIPESLFGWFRLVIYLLTPFIGGIILTRRNLRSGRGDVRGALLVGVAITLFYVVQYLLSVRAGELGLYRLIGGVFWGPPGAHALLHAVLMTLAYLAIEPYVRRLWPSGLVSWARLVAGRWRDPIVGRDVLIGSVLGMATTLVFLGGAHLMRVVGMDATAAQFPPGVLANVLVPQSVLAAAAYGIAVAFLYGTFTFTLLVILRFILRNNLSAALVAVVLTGVLDLAWGSKGFWFSAAVSVLTSGMVIFVAVRYGYVAIIVGGAVQNLLTNVPWTTHVGGWYAPQILLGWVLVVVPLVFGFTVAVGGRSLFRDPLSDPVLPGGKAAR